MKLSILIPAAVLALALSASADPGELFPDAGNSRPTRAPRPTPPAESFPAVARPTPAQIGAAAQTARKTISEFATKNKLRLAEIPTDHFMIFSDCGRENDHIARTLEAAYASLTQALGIAAAETPFVGRLPVVVLADHAALRPFAERDGVGLVAGSIGYYIDASENPFSHIVMSCPLVPGASDPDTLAWSSAVSRELTRAILIRHRTTRPLPNWLSIGLAEHAAPTPVAPDAAAKPRPELSALLTPAAIAPDHMPACGSLVDLLLARDAKAFADFVRVLKTGTPLNSALDRCFKLNTAKLETLWKAVPANSTASPMPAADTAG